MTDDRSPLLLDDAMRALHAARHEDDIVVTTMGAARVWMALGADRRDLVLVPSAMGHATSFGLGLALAQPQQRVIVANGDGSMLMNLGALVSITAARAPNLVLIVCDNGVYEVTGSQPTPGTAAGRDGADGVDFAAIARACGFPSVFRFSDLPSWRSNIATALGAQGPVFIALDVVSVPGTPGPRSPGPAPERARRFREAISRSPTAPV